MALPFTLRLYGRSKRITAIFSESNLHSLTVLVKTRPAFTGSSISLRTVIRNIVIITMVLLRQPCRTKHGSAIIWTTKTAGVRLGGATTFYPGKATSLVLNSGSKVETLFNRLDGQVLTCITRNMNCTLETELSCFLRFNLVAILDL